MIAPLAFCCGRLSPTMFICPTLAILTGHFEVDLVGRDFPSQFVFREQMLARLADRTMLAEPWSSDAHGSLILIKTGISNFD